jgi:WhiB family redox-sensing transcriptional regulator
LTSSRLELLASAAQQVEEEGSAVRHLGVVGESGSSVVWPPCAEAPELFFAEQPAQFEAAKSLCGGCPVREACLAGALERGEPWGVWGGELVLDGAVAAAKRGRGRPRKHEPAA